jgi:hypothetical protein
VQLCQFQITARKLGCMFCLLCCRTGSNRLVPVIHAQQITGQSVWNSNENCNYVLKSAPGNVCNPVAYLSMSREDFERSDYGFPFGKCQV